MLHAPVLRCASGAVHQHFVGRGAGSKDLLLLAALLELAWLGDHCPGEPRRDLEDPMPGRTVFTPRTRRRFGNGLGSCRSVSACVVRAAAIGMKDPL